jgi:hypothetical protein
MGFFIFRKAKKIKKRQNRGASSEDLNHPPDNSSELSYNALICTTLHFTKYLILNRFETFS